MTGRSGLEAVGDRELMRLHCAGEPDAFGELFRRHRDRMWAVAVRTTGDPELASDCVQEAFIAAFRRAASYRGDAAVTTWLHRVVVNACLDGLRRARPSMPLEGVGLADRRDGHGELETAMDVRRALASLPEGQRLALALVDMHGLPVAEAAAVLNVPEGTIKSRCSRGRTAMAGLLGLALSGHPGGPREPCGPP